MDAGWMDWGIGGDEGEEEAARGMSDGCMGEREGGGSVGPTKQVRACEVALADTSRVAIKTLTRPGVLPTLPAAPRKPCLRLARKELDTDKRRTTAKFASVYMPTHPSIP